MRVVVQLYLPYEKDFTSEATQCRWAHLALLHWLAMDRGEL